MAVEIYATNEADNVCVVTQEPCYYSYQLHTTILVSALGLINLELSSVCVGCFCFIITETSLICLLC